MRRTPTPDWLFDLDLLARQAGLRRLEQPHAAWALAWALTAMEVPARAWTATVVLHTREPHSPGLAGPHTHYWELGAVTWEGRLWTLAGARTWEDALIERAGGVLNPRRRQDFPTGYASCVSFFEPPRVLGQAPGKDLERHTAGLVGLMTAAERQVPVDRLGGTDAMPAGLPDADWLRRLVQGESGLPGPGGPALVRVGRGRESSLGVWATDPKLPADPLGPRALWRWSDSAVNSRLEAMALEQRLALAPGTGRARL